MLKKVDIQSADQAFGFAGDTRQKAFNKHTNTLFAQLLSSSIKEKLTKLPKHQQRLPTCLC